MSAPNLPNTLLKLGLALAKHHIKNVIGDEALEIAASTLTDVGGEKIQTKVDSIFASKEGQKELLKAAKSADERFKEKCKDNDLRQLFSMDYGDLPSVQEAIASLPQALDDETLRITLFVAFRDDVPKRISDEQISEGVSLYVECLQSALLPVKDFGLRIIHNALKEIGKDVKDIKADVKSLLEKTTANSQDATASKKSYARFLVPFPHNPDFVGRDTELANLHEILQNGGSIVGIRPTVLVGLGGIGKTQLAVEYAHAYRADYPSGVFWLNAINPLLFEFSDLAEELEMADRATPRDKAARKAWDYLDSHPDALVIFDNVLEPSELNLPFSPDLVPANLRCRTLFTTRQRDFPRTFQPFEVKTLPEMAAMKLLLRSRPEVFKEHHPEWGWARIVCAELGWLPLALELAAAYLGAYPEVSITGYLERLRMEGSLETVDASEVRAVDLPTRVEEILKAAAARNLEIKHQVAVSATLQTQWKRLDDDARVLFRAAGQFPEASWIPIPRLGLLTGIESEAKVGRPSPLNVVLKKLHAVSLIEELSDDRLRLHPLVQEFAARLAPASFRLEMAERVVAEFDDLLRFQDRVIRYGVDLALEDLRTALNFCVEQPETETYSRISKMERVLDRQAHGLRNWNAQEEPAFFFQQIRQIRNEGFAQGLRHWQVQAEAELSRLKKPYLFECFPTCSDSAELRTLMNYKKVQSVALSADGRLAISGSDDASTVWDVQTGRELRTIKERGYVVALSADGRLAASVSSEKITVWDVSTGHELHKLGEDVGFFLPAVALSADGKLVVSTSDDKLVKVWDVATGRDLCTFKGHVGFVEGVALSADGKLVVSASEDKTLKVWDVGTGRELRTLIGHSDSVRKVVLSMDGQLVISASQDKTLKIWDVTTGRALHTLSGHHGAVLGVALSADGRLAISASADKTVKLWDVAMGRELFTLNGHNNSVVSVALSGDGRIAISASYDGTLKVWDISTALSSVRENTVNSLYIDTNKIPNDGFVEDIKLSADGRLAVATSNDNTLKVWDVKTGKELHTFRGHSNSVNSVALSANGKLVVSASYDGSIKVWDVGTGLEMRTLRGSSDKVKVVALSADGQLAVSAPNDKTLKVWDVVTGHELQTLTGHDDRVHHLVLSLDGRLAVSASDDTTFKVWDVEKGRELRTITGQSSVQSELALSANGQVAVSVRFDKLELWDIETGRILRTLPGHSYYVNGVALSADGRLVVSASEDQTLKVWDVISNRCIATLLVGASLTSCAMSVDGRTIVAGDWLGGIHFLELIGADELLAKDVKIEKSWLALKKESESRS